MTMPSAAVLLVQGGPNEGAMVPLAEGISIMGRATLSDIVIEGTGVSRQHASIRGAADGYWIADLGSRNGTFVNGAQIGQEGQRLNNWDRIELGGMETHWVFMESQDTVELQRPG